MITAGNISEVLWNTAQLLFWKSSGYCFSISTLTVGNMQIYFYSTEMKNSTQLMIKLSFNPIQDWLFQGCSRMGGPSLKSATHILQWWNLAVIPYLRKIQKVYKSRDTSLEFCWHQHFFTRNQQILLHQEIHI